MVRCKNHLTLKQNTTMKRTYICPAISMDEALSVQMLAESLVISDTVVDGSKALTKEDDSWNIWEEEE